MPAPNQRISEYLLEERIGAGAFGEVWRARHHVWSDQFVAVKIPTDPQYIRNLQSEGAAIHGLVHPSIVRAMGFDPYADPPYLVMEYVPGSSLRPLIQDRSLKVADAVAVMKHVLAGLSHAHKNGLVHRDIKPENILVNQRTRTEGFSAEGLIKVTDFGLGKVAKVAAESIAYSASMNADDARRISGTLDYMPPEQRSGIDVDARADIYACGVVLFEMLTGERPAGTDLPSDVNPSVPKYLDEAFKRSYARLDKRFASADDFITHLSGGQSFGSTMPRPPAIPHLHASDMSKACPGCRQPIGSADQFCMHCGLQLVSQVKRCPQCGAYPDQDDRFCIFCGQNFTSV